MSKDNKQGFNLLAILAESKDPKRLMFVQFKIAFSIFVLSLAVHGADPLKSAACSEEVRTYAKEKAEFDQNPTARLAQAMVSQGISGSKLMAASDLTSAVAGAGVGGVAGNIAAKNIANRVVRANSDYNSRMSYLKRYFEKERVSADWMHKKSFARAEVLSNAPSLSGSTADLDDLIFKNGTTATNSIDDVLKKLGKLGPNSTTAIKNYYKTLREWAQFETENQFFSRQNTTLHQQLVNEGVISPKETRAAKAINDGEASARVEEERTNSQRRLRVKEVERMNKLKGKSRAFATTAGAAAGFVGGALIGNVVAPEVVKRSCKLQGLNATQIKTLAGFLQVTASGCRLSESGAKALAEKDTTSVMALCEEIPQVNDIIYGFLEKHREEAKKIPVPDEASMTLNCHPDGTIATTKIELKSTGRSCAMSRIDEDKKQVIIKVEDPNYKFGTKNEFDFTAAFDTEKNQITKINSSANLYPSGAVKSNSASDYMKYAMDMSLASVPTEANARKQFSAGECAFVLNALAPQIEASCQELIRNPSNQTSDRSGQK